MPGPAPWDAPPHRRGAGEQVREFFAGIGVFLRGVRMWATRPGLMALGAVPALIVSIAYVIAIVALGANAGSLAEWATPFADGWPDAGRQLLRVLVAVAIVAAAVAAGVLTFAAVTLAVAAPFMERISRAVDVELGGAPAPIDEPVLRAIGRGIGDALKLIGVALLTAVAVFAIGLIPVIGSVLGWTTGAVLGGRALAVDLTGAPAEARGDPARPARAAHRPQPGPHARLRHDDLPRLPHPRGRGRRHAGGGGRRHAAAARARRPAGAARPPDHGAGRRGAAPAAAQRPLARLAA